MFGFDRPFFVVALACVFLVTPFALGQTRPWVQYADPAGGLICGLIHGSNAEYVVLPASGALVKVSGADIVLRDLVVDSVGNVLYGDQPAGIIGFEIDADGDRALFWMTLTGQLVAIDSFDASPSQSDLYPSDLRNTGCDACPQWDNPAACDDSDGSDDSNTDDVSDSSTSLLTNLCGAGSGLAVMLSMAMLTAGKSQRTWRRRRSCV